MSKTFGMIGGGGGGIKLASIAITTPPAKTTYMAGETFDPAGMVVEATYSNGAKAVATGYSYTPSTALTDGTTAVTIQYTEGGVTKTAEQAITVSKAAGSLSISPTSLTLDKTNPAGEIIVDRAGDGAISAVSSAPDIAEVSVSGNIVTVTGKANGSATITISVAEGTNHTAPASKTCAVTVSILNDNFKDNFSDNEWSDIIAACQSRRVPKSWVVGNSKTMTINGVDYQIDIIGKNHDDYSDGSGKAPLTFQMHDCYADKKGMNNSPTNSGGWTSCAMRNTHLPAILAMMPTEVQNGIREVNKLTSAGDLSSTINTTADKLFLLSEIEIFGSVSFSFAGEGTQYDYYKAGNSRVKKVNGTEKEWWERSPYKSQNVFFCNVGTGTGGAGANGAPIALGVAFGFCF